MHSNLHKQILTTNKINCKENIENHPSNDMTTHLNSNKKENFMYSEQQITDLSSNAFKNSFELSVCPNFLHSVYSSREKNYLTDQTLGELPKNEPHLIAFFCHGATSSKKTFFKLFQELNKLTDNGKFELITYDLQSHGSTKRTKDKVQEKSYSKELLNIKDLTESFLNIIKRFEPYSRQIVIIGHSLGGCIAVKVALEIEKNKSIKNLRSKIKGIVLIDCIEPTSEELDILISKEQNSQKQIFKSYKQAIQWAAKEHKINNIESLCVSIPHILKETQSGDLIFKVNYSDTKKYWKEWFKNLTKGFIELKNLNKLLIVSTPQRLNKDLTIAHMQGKFQLYVTKEKASHFIHEQNPEEIAKILNDFFNRLLSLLLLNKE